MYQDKEAYELFISRIEKFMTTKTYRKNEYIFNESDVEEKIYIVKSGKVEVCKLTKTWEERLLFIVSEGSILNEEILFSDTSECATSCRAYDDVKIIAVPKKNVIAEMQMNVKSMEFIFTAISLKLKRTYRQLKNSGTNVTIDRKIASKLWKLSLDYGVENADGSNYIDFSLSSSTISKMVGAKRETVSRCLKKFKKDGVVKVVGDKITILDLEKLSKIFEQS